MSRQQKRQAVVFPKEQKILNQLGENIRLALKRRKITQTMLAERTGISKPTLRNITRGESSVSIGHYLRVLAVLGLAEDLSKVALDDEMGRKLQDIKLLKDAQQIADAIPVNRLNRSKVKFRTMPAAINTDGLKELLVQVQAQTQAQVQANKAKDKAKAKAKAQSDATPADRLNRIFAEARDKVRMIAIDEPTRARLMASLQNSDDGDSE